MAATDSSEVKVMFKVKVKDHPLLLPGSHLIVIQSYLSLVELLVFLI
jgi:hypothetical protein